MRRSWTHCRDCPGKATLFHLDRKASQLGEELQRRSKQPLKSLRRPNYMKVVWKSTASTLLSISVRCKVRSYHLHKTSKRERPTRNSVESYEIVQRGLPARHGSLPVLEIKQIHLQDKRTMIIHHNLFEIPHIFYATIPWPWLDSMYYVFLQP